MQLVQPSKFFQCYYFRMHSIGSIGMHTCMPMPSLFSLHALFSKGVYKPLREVVSFPDSTHHCVKVGLDSCQPVKTK